MKFLSFEKLALELTRKCTLRCAHCARGDSQDVTLSRENIDAILNQAELIGGLEFSGGEPMLALDLMEHVLQKAKELDVPVFNLSAVSNGLVLPELTVPTLRRWSEYVRWCNERWKGDRSSGDQFFELSISQDKYHAHANISQRHIQEYRERLAGYAMITTSVMGNTPFYTGNARKYLNIKNTLGLEEEHPVFNRQIAIIDETHKPICLSARDYQLFYEKQVVVCCGLYMTAKGALIPIEIGLRYDYETLDDERNTICMATDDIYNEILRYNQGRPDCFEFKLSELAKQREASQRDASHMLKFTLRHLPEVLATLNNGSGSPFAKRFPSVLSEDELRKLNDPAQAEQFLAQLRREALDKNYMPRDKTKGIKV